jgi:hypothetical protein
LFVKLFETASNSFAGRSTTMRYLKVLSGLRTAELMAIKYKQIPQQGKQDSFSVKLVELSETQCLKKRVKTIIFLLM